MSTAIHRALAHFFSGVSETDAQWRSVKLLHPEVPSLAEALQLSQASLEELLIESKLGCKRNGHFVFRPTQFQSWIIDAFELHELTELNKHNVDGFAKQQWFVRIGSLNKHAIGAAGRKGMCPRILNHRDSLRAMSSVLLTSLSNSDNNNNEAEPNRSPVAESIVEENTTEAALLIKVKSNLLPLLLKPELLEETEIGAPWLEKINSEKLFAAIEEIASKIVAKREEKISNILGTERASISPNSKNKICPTIWKFGIPMEDTRVANNLLNDLIALNEKVNKTTTVACYHQNNVVVQFVRIPQSKDYSCLQRNTSRSKWLDKVLAALGGGSDENTIQETMYNLLNYITNTRQFAKCWSEVVHLNGGGSSHRLDPIATQAVLSMANLNDWQACQLRKGFLAEIGTHCIQRARYVKQTRSLEYPQRIKEYQIIY